MVLHRLPGDRGSQASRKEAGSRELEASNPWRCGGGEGGATELRFPWSESLFTGFTKPLLRPCADEVLPRQAPAPAAQGTGTHPLLSVRSWRSPQRPLPSAPWGRDPSRAGRAHAPVPSLCPTCTCPLTSLCASLSRHLVQVPPPTQSLP